MRKGLLHERRQILGPQSFSSLGHIRYTWCNTFVISRLTFYLPLCKTSHQQALIPNSIKVQNSSSWQPVQGTQVKYSGIHLNFCPLFIKGLETHCQPPFEAFQVQLVKWKMSLPFHLWSTAVYCLLNAKGQMRISRHLQ